MLYIIIIFSFYSLVHSQSLFFNEIMSSNSSIIQDSDGDYSDWIELYNNSSNDIVLKDYYLSDDSTALLKWNFPNILLPPNQYILVFSSGKNKLDGELHTNFKISSEGEDLFLCDSLGNILSKVASVNIPNDISYGKNFTSGEWLFYENPTPGIQNANSGHQVITSDPIFSISGGLYESAVTLELTNERSEATIFYTSDGSEPTTSSTKYLSSISIDTTTVVRAKSFQTNALPSNIITQTYLINETTSLPIISLATNPNNFWDDQIGIYVVGTNGIPGPCNGETANFYQEWERPIHIEFYEKDGSQGFSIDAGVKIHGGCTRKLDQKSLAIIARPEYGFKDIPYNIFPELPFDSYNSILLRSSGNDNSVTMIRDAHMQGLVEDLDIETQAYRPCIVFLNGEYFGIHNIRERINREYYYQHYNLGSSDIDLLANSKTVKQGSDEHYVNMLNFLKNHDLSLMENYDFIQTQMDISNYITYMISEMYCANLDWYPYNTKFWRPQTQEGKWRWILFDTDYGYGLFYDTISKNMLTLVQNEEKFPSVIFNSLLKNNNFKNSFINRFADLANSAFKPEIAVTRIDSYKTIIQNELPQQISKWHGIPSLWRWNQNIEELKYFANNRLPNMYQNFINDFFLVGKAQINLTNTNIRMGEIQLNSIKINDSEWSGEYFQGIPIKLAAIPKLGFEFAGWSGDITSSQLSISFTPNEMNNITASFARIDSSNLPSIIINEINYKSCGQLNTGDWLELYNNSGATADLSGWFIKDEDDNHLFTFPENVILNNDSYLIVSCSLEDFKLYYPDVSNIIGDLSFKFSSEGDLIRLYHPSHSLVDIVAYNNNSDWPTKPNGTGPTLELKNPILDNSNAFSWKASLNDGGTPGIINSTFYNYYSCSPTNIELIISENSLDLKWSKCEDSEFDFYGIYRSLDPEFLPDTMKNIYSTTVDTVYSDVNIINGNTYYYQVGVFDTNGFHGKYSEKVFALITDIKESESLPNNYQLYQNYPNPFNPTTAIRYSVPNIATSQDLSLQQNISLRVYDILGKEIITLVNKFQDNGNYEIEFDGSKLSSGIYYYQLKAGEFISTKKMILLK